jgi:Kef-type K+ transport system membrane component KefB
MPFLVCLIFLLFPFPDTFIYEGGFLAGLVIPHENGYAISMVEKLEDLVSILFLPIVRHPIQFSIRSESNAGS